MANTWGKFAIEQLRRPEVSFESKLRQVERLLPMADEILGAQLTRVLLEGALEIKPSKRELFYLCDVTESSAMLGDYLRGMFKEAETDPARVEMAERLEQVLIYRMSQPKVEKQSDTKLHQTVSEYLLRAKN